MMNIDTWQCVWGHMLCECSYLESLLRHSELSSYNREQVGMWDRQVKEILATNISKYLASW